MRGRLIAIEGIDGSGKTSQVELLAGAQQRAGTVTVTAEPGATVLGAGLRGLLLDPDLPPVAERSEALLMAADRAQHMAEVVSPALAAGRWVVTDRFSGSTLAYQGYGRGLDVDELRRLVDWATGGIAPDLNVVVDVPVEVGRRRRAGGRDDRLESLGDDFQERVRSGYLALAAADPDHWVVVDGVGEVQEVSLRLSAAVVARLGALPGGAR
ncbi:MAG TPA: dTMP kinase [Acidimicrobiales bacterium]|nr:dTMP kinase [Acidimicrobiales bacterium]